MMMDALMDENETVFLVFFVETDRRREVFDRVFYTAEKAIQYCNKQRKVLGGSWEFREVEIE